MKNQLSAVRVGLSLGLISALRIFGLMVIVPILSLHASDYHTNYGGVGLAIGIYGLFQAIGQMPFGRLSDQYGRKNVLTFGGSGLEGGGSTITQQLAKNLFKIRR